MLPLLLPPAPMKTMNSALDDAEQILPPLLMHVQGRMMIRRQRTNAASTAATQACEVEKQRRKRLRLDANTTAFARKTE